MKPIIYWALPDICNKRLNVKIPPVLNILFWEKHYDFKDK